MTTVMVRADDLRWMQAVFTAARRVAHAYVSNGDAKPIAVVDSLVDALSGAPPLAQTWEGLEDEIAEWQARTFPEATASSAARHLVKEANELLHAIQHGPQSDAREELADVRHLVVAVSRAIGGMREDVAEKLATNKTRRWQKPDADGVVEHVKTDTPSEADAAARALGEVSS